MEVDKKLLAFLAEEAIERCDHRALGVLLNAAVAAEEHQILCEIHKTLCDTQIPDAACYWKIERIMNSFRRRDIPLGERHAMPQNEYGEIPISSLWEEKE